MNSRQSQACWFPLVSVFMLSLANVNLTPALCLTYRIEIDINLLILLSIIIFPQMWSYSFKHFFISSITKIEQAISLQTTALWYQSPSFFLLYQWVVRADLTCLLWGNSGESQKMKWIPAAGLLTDLQYKCKASIIFNCFQDPPATVDRITDF